MPCFGTGSVLRTEISLPLILPVRYFSFMFLALCCYNGNVVTVILISTEK